MEDQTQGQSSQPAPSSPEATPAPMPAAQTPAPEMGEVKKSSWAKTLLIYVVLAVIVYAVIYYLFLK